jgi:hypothetical protein
MKVLKTVVMIKESGAIFECDTIIYQGKKWLVPMWIDTPALKLTTPTRIILLDNLPHQKAGPQQKADFVLNTPIPKSVWNGIQPQPETGFVVVEKPDISPDEIEDLH